MKTLAVPIHLDALFLERSTVVKAAQADFTRLPYTDGIRDYNSDVPYLSEAILDAPFQDKRLLLSAGVHLHWALPWGLTKTVGIQLLGIEQLDTLRSYFPEEISTNSINWTQAKALTWNELLAKSGWIKAIDENRASIMAMDSVEQVAFDTELARMALEYGWNEKDTVRFVSALMGLLNRPLGNEYASVPNTWLVTRKLKNKITGAWMVESNFLATKRDPADHNAASVNIPFHDDRHDNKTPPFRYIGRQLPLEVIGKWQSGDRQEDTYLREITAVGFNPQPGSKGYADPTFAAFYPNCLSVFGLYDPDPPVDRTDLSYEVMGCYRSLDQDCLSTFLRDFANRVPVDGDYYAKLQEALLNEFRWDVKDFLLDADSTPKGLTLFGKAIPKVPNLPQADRIQVAVGNTGTEALSAFLARNLSGDKAENEALLESVQLSSRLQNRVLDVGHKFREARHDKGFTALPGGTLWTVKMESVQSETAANTNEDHTSSVTIPANIHMLLHEVNDLQVAYDKACGEMPHLRRELFSDWYRYLLNAYPAPDARYTIFDQDEVMRYIQANGIAELRRKLGDLGNLSIAKDEQGRFKGIRHEGNVDSLAEQLAIKTRELSDAVNAFSREEDAKGKTWMDKGKCLALRTTAAPRFWRPNDPVVLFAERREDNQLTALNNDRYDAPGEKLPTVCSLIDAAMDTELGYTYAEAAALLQQLSKLYADRIETGNQDSSATWNPLLLEWQLDLIPAFPLSNAATSDYRYDPNYISQQYQLNTTDTDLSLAAPTDIFQSAMPYTGSTILTPGPKVSLSRVIRQFLDEFGDGQSATLRDKLDQASKNLERTHVLSQSLGGFNEALLMKKQIRQLDVADPLGFNEYQQFTKETAALVRKSNLTAPQPDGFFNPIRCGLLQLVKLRLIDTFGQTLDLTTPPIVPSTPVEQIDRPGHIHLKPRLTQFARLNFRLLAAEAENQETNTHPDSGPICGWLLPNNLDGSIQFYDSSGNALGELTHNASNPWLPAPSTSAATFIGNINNSHLRRVATYLYNRQRESIAQTGSADNSFLDHMLAALDNALENCNPENFAEHPELAVLIGQPIAVVRAKLGLELESPPATDKSWTQFSHELLGQDKSTDDFEKVKFPIRIGEYQQHNDGVIGYWTEAADGTLSADYFSSEAGENPDPRIKSYVAGGESYNLFCALADEPAYVTLLVEPKGMINVVSGILPVKTITIPKDQYRDALQRIAVTYLTAPVISAGGHLKLSPPKEPGYQWSWLEKAPNDSWSEIRQTVLIERTLFDGKFPDRPELWQQLVTKKWLEPVAANPRQAVVTAAVHRAFPPDATTDPAPFPIDIGKRLDNFFDVYGRRIEPFEQHVSFSGPQQIREGWLRLAPVPPDNPDVS